MNSKASLRVHFVLIGALLTYSQFQLLDIGSTSNPTFLILAIAAVSWLGSSVRAVFLVILMRAFLCIALSSLLMYFAASSPLPSFLDARFITTLFTVLILLASFISFGEFLATLKPVVHVSLLARVTVFMIIVLSLGMLLNVFNLHCYFFKCRIFGGSLGFSMFNSEPAYTGIMVFAIICLYAYSSSLELLPTAAMQRNSRILLMASFATLLGSASPLVFGSISLYGFFVYLFLKAIRWNHRIPKHTGRIKLTTITLITIIVVAILYVATFTKVGAEFWSFVDPSSYDFTSSQQLENPFETLTFLGGNRISYFMSFLYFDKISLFFGHGLYSSSFLFEAAVSSFYENFILVGFFSHFGAKPDSLLTQLIFSFGIIGSMLIFIEAVCIFTQQLRRCLSSRNVGYLQLWMACSPIFLLIYPCPNTDPWKYIALSLFIGFSKISNARNFVLPVI
jgi:hypothetical protein